MLANLNKRRTIKAKVNKKDHIRKEVSLKQIKILLSKIKKQHNNKKLAKKIPKIHLALAIIT